MTIPSKNDNTSYITEKLLQQIGIQNPSEKQIAQTRSILASVGIVFAEIKFNKNLTEQECACLYWLVKGKTAVEIAKLLDIAEPTVRTYLLRIKQKLNCKTLEQAVYEGIRYCFVRPNLEKSLSSQQ